MHAALPQIGKTLKVEINKTDMQNLSVSRIVTENLPPEDYKVSFTDNYYNLQILGASDALLFSGQTKSRLIQPVADPLTPGPVEGHVVELKYPLMTLNFPYYAEAKKIRILDENNKLLLEINLVLYGIPGSTVSYGECDSCGFCKSSKPPEDWEKCRACLYPSANTDPESGDTIRIESGAQVTSEPGKAYTGLGCISSAGFTKESGRAAATRTVVNFLTGITGGIAFIFLLYGAFVILTAKGDPEQVKRGKTVIMRTLIGAVLVLLQLAHWLLH